jgi:hypothetical protein
MPRGGWLRKVRRWACCGLRRTGGPSPGFGAFSSSLYSLPPYTVCLFVLGLWGPAASRYCGAVRGWLDV